MTWEAVVAGAIMGAIPSVATTFKWIVERHDRRDDMAKAKDDALEALEEMQKTITAKDVELGQKDRLIEKQEHRIEHLEDLAFGGKNGR